MKKTFICLTLLLSVFCLFAQDMTDSAKKVKKQVVSSEYDRNSLTIIGLDFPNAQSANLAKCIETAVVPDKFYSNDLGFRMIPANFEINLYDPAKQKQIFNTDVLNLLKEKKVGQGIIAKWFNRQADGTFNTSVLKERGVYNSDDSDLKIASAAKRGESTLMDAGLGLVDKSYILVMGFANIQSMNQYYDKIEAKPEQRTSNGFKADMIGYLYKLNFSDSVAAVFFQDLWLSQTSADANAKIEKFNATNFPLIPIKSFAMPMQASQYNPGHTLAPKVQKTSDELLKDMVNTSITSVLTQFEKQVDEFKVKAQIYKTNPIAVKIGKKEGLGFDQTYFVYENRMASSGQTYSSRRGVIKSMKVADNRANTSGETQPSLFYQVAGHKIDNMGMFIEQHNDAGLNLFLGYAQDGLAGIDGRLEYYIGRFLNVPSFKMYVEGGYNINSDETTLESITKMEEITQWHVSAGLNKDFYLTKNIHWGPFAGYGIESVDGKTSKYKLETQFIEAGARLGLNITYNIQLIGSANYYIMLSPELKDKDGKVIPFTKNEDYKTFFPDFKSFGYSYGIRFMF